MANLLKASILWLNTYIAFFAFTTASRSNGETPNGAIDAATVAAYEKLGAVYGGLPKKAAPFYDPTLDILDEVRALRDGRAFAEKGLPCFRFKSFPRAKFPAVSIPFGLQLSFSGATDAGLKQLVGLRQLVALNLFGCKITDIGTKELVALENLTSLNLFGSTVTDAGLKELASLKKLVSLNLWGTKITDAGLKALGDHREFRILVLGYTKVTDAGLKEITGMTRLIALSLEGMWCAPGAGPVP